MKKKVEYVLIELGIYPNLFGFDYICKAIEIINESTERMKIVDGLYVDIAKQFNSQKNRVERAIRHAISKIDKSSDAWNEYLGIKETTNSTFLYTLATRLKED